jgi:hypothetical protein
VGLAKAGGAMSHERMERVVEMRIRVLLARTESGFDTNVEARALLEAMRECKTAGLYRCEFDLSKVLP